MSTYTVKGAQEVFQIKGTLPRMNCMMLTTSTTG